MNMLHLVRFLKSIFLVLSNDFLIHCFAWLPTYDNQTPIAQKETPQKTNLQLYITVCVYK